MVSRSPLHFGKEALTVFRAINRDPSVYPDPEAFKPERWLEPRYPTYKEPLAYYPSLKGHSGFGWGRRACPGQDHSEIVHFTVISMILWSSQICTKKDPVTGKEILPPVMDYTPYVIVRPNWWEFEVKTRDKGKLDVINS
jgi:Cytochrome P450